MQKIISIIIVLTLVLSSCAQEPLANIQKSYQTFVVESGTLTLVDTLTATIEGDTISDLAFKIGGMVSRVLVRPGDRVKKGQILAELGNQESAIQLDAFGNIEQKLEDLGVSTSAVKMSTENLQKSTAKLYDTRLAGIDSNILSLQNTIAKATQNLGNQTSALMVTFSTLAHDYDRVVSNMLYEGDKILGITTNFEYANDSWEPYLGTRVGTTKVGADNAWGKLYASRGKIRAMMESGAIVPDINIVIQELVDAYTNARLYASSMNYMLQNSVVGGGLPEEKLNAWVTAWLGFSTDEQQSEANFMNWKNGSLNITNTGSGSGTVADKDIRALELDLKNLQISRETLLAEKTTKLKEIQTSVAGAQSQREQISVQIEQTRMSSALAGISLEYNILRAPYDGVILTKSINVGNMVGAGASVMRISSLDKSIVRTYIDNELYRYKLGDSISINKLSTQSTLTGVVTLIQREKDPLHNKNYTEITLKNTGMSIGERVSISLVRKKIPLQNGVIVPLASIITRYGPPGVFQVQDGKAVFTLIKIIGSDLSLAEVIGISGGSTLITGGKENVIDGEILSPSNRVPAEIFSKK